MTLASWITVMSAVASELMRVLTEVAKTLL